MSICEIQQIEVPPATVSFILHTKMNVYKTMWIKS